MLGDKKHDARARTRYVADVRNWARKTVWATVRSIVPSSSGTQRNRLDGFTPAIVRAHLCRDTLPAQVMWQMCTSELAESDGCCVLPRFTYLRPRLCAPMC